MGFPIEIVLGWGVAFFILGLLMFLGYGLIELYIRRTRKDKHSDTPKVVSGVDTDVQQTTDW